MVEDFDPRFTLSALPDLPSYLFTPDMGIVDVSVDDTAPRMFLLPPGAKGRDLNNIAVVPQGGEDWLRQGGALSPSGGQEWRLCNADVKQVASDRGSRGRALSVRATPCTRPCSGRPATR